MLAHAFSLTTASVRPTPRIATKAPRTVLRLALPAIVHMVLLSAVFVADRTLLAHYSEDALASLHISTTLSWTACSIFGALAVGTLSVVGHALGAGRRNYAANLARAALLIALVGGVFVAAALYLLRRPLVTQLLGASDPTIVQLADDYLLIVLPALPLCFLELTASAALHAAGDTRTPLAGALFGNVLNVVCSATLVFGLGGMPELGVKGAALGSALAFFVAASITLSRLHAGGGPIPLKASATAWSSSLSAAWHLWRVTRGAVGEKLSYHTGYLLYAALIVSLGAESMANNQALLGLEAGACAIADGFAIAAGSLVAKDLGSRDPERARAHLRAAATMAVTVLGAMGMMFACSSTAIFSAFAPQQSGALQIASTMTALAFAQPFMAYATVSSMALRSAGATRTVWFGAAIGTLLLRPLVGYGLAIVMNLGLLGIWLASAADWVCRSVIFAIAWQRLSSRR